MDLNKGPERRKEDAEFFCREMEAFYPKMRKIASHKLPKDIFNVEDVLQTVCMKAWNGLDNLQDRSKFRSWVQVILNNTINEYYRVYYREKEILYLPGDINEELERLAGAACRTTDPGVQDTVLKALIDKDNRKIMIEAFERLDEKYQSLLRMYLLNEYSQGEIAEISGLNESTVRTRIHRAMKKMAELYRELSEEGDYE